MPRIFGLRSCLQEVQDSIQLFGENNHHDESPLKNRQESHHTKNIVKHDPQENMWHVSHTELTLGSFENLDDINITGKTF